MREHPEGKEGGPLSASFVTGAIALAFLVAGYQTALFMHRAAVLRIVAEAEHPDTVYVRAEDTVRRDASHAPAVQAVRRAYLPRTYESFRFDPNTVSVADLQRLGFSRKQAEAIEAYRRKGGRFRRKEDFAKSYVVADSVYGRLAPFIDIPLLDLNAADSAAFDDLPGIGPYYAARMAAYRRALGGYSCKEQLMDIRGFDAERYAGLQDLVTVGPSRPYPLWTAPEDSLALHPYIGRRAAHGIILYRDNHPRTDWTVEKLGKAGVLDADLADKLLRCRIEDPDGCGDQSSI